jgi:mannose-6-phosphate isomerase
MCFEPWLRAMPWGGDKLLLLFDGTFAYHPIGEAWLVSDHRLHESLLLNQPETTFRDVLNGDALNITGSTNSCRFPLLIKLLDAQQNLSVQVHPDDQQALKWAPGEGGKTEAWHVLAADPGSEIYLGVKPGIDRATFEREVLSGNVRLCLERYDPKPGETYYIPAGTVHALGQGVLVLEVQQTSDATFRLYDWGRVGADGQPRQLHLDAALACTQLLPNGAGLQKSQLCADGAELLVQTPFFTLRRWKAVRNVRITAPAIVVAWDGPVQWGGSGNLPNGHACLIPAGLKHVDMILTENASAFEIKW